MEENEKIVIAQSRNFGDIISDTFTLIRHGFKPLGKALLYVIGPMILIVSVLMGFFQAETTGSIFTQPLLKQAAGNSSIERLFSDYGAILVVGYILVIVLSLVITTLMQAYTYEYINLYNKKDYKDISFQDIIKNGNKHGFKLFFTNIGLGFFVMIILGFFILLFMGVINALVSDKTTGFVFIPIILLLMMTVGLYFIIMLAIVPAIRVFEPLGFWKSIKRSLKLMFGNFWNTFGLLFILSIIIGFMATVFTIPYMAILTVMTVHLAQKQVANLPYLKPLLVASSSIMGLSSFLYIIPFLSMGLKYFSLKETKEGESLMQKIDFLSNGESTLES